MPPMEDFNPAMFPPLPMLLSKGSKKEENYPFPSLLNYDQGYSDQVMEMDIEFDQPPCLPKLGKADSKMAMPNLNLKPNHIPPDFSFPTNLDPLPKIMMPDYNALNFELISSLEGRSEGILGQEDITSLYRDISSYTLR